MKNNQFKPKKNNLSLAWEKINTIIERDLAFVIVIMASGLLHSNEYGLRGFPVPWLSAAEGAHMHSSPGAFVTSFIAVFAMVAVAEILNAVYRRGSEPSALRSSGQQTSVYANTYDDTQEFQDIPDTGAFESKDTRNYSKALRKNEKLFRKVEAAINTPPVRTKYVMNHGEKIVLRVVLAIFASSIILLGAISGVLFINDSYEDDIASDDYDTEYTDDSYDYGSLIGTPFFDDDSYLQDECDRIIGMLIDEDEEGLSEIGEGDAAALIGLADWGNSEYVRDYRFAVSEEPDQGFIRFLVTSGDKKYMLGIKFEGDGLATDESKAVVTGVTACPHTPWEELDPEDEDYWNILENKVEEQNATVGNADFMGYSILTW